MSITIVGPIADAQGLAMWPAPSRWVDGVEVWRGEARYDCTPSASYRDEQPRRIPVLVGHAGGPVGEVVHIEHLGRCLDAVAVVDEDVLDELGDAVYFSAQTQARRYDGALETHDAQLQHLGLTRSPASVALAPVRRIAEGDVRRSSDRAGWPMSWRTTWPVLRRAVDAVERRGYGAPLVIERSIDARAQRARSGQLGERIVRNYGEHGAGVIDVR